MDGKIFYPLSLLIYLTFPDGQSARHRNEIRQSSVCLLITPHPIKPIWIIIIDVTVREQWTISRNICIMIATNITMSTPLVLLKFCPRSQTPPAEFIFENGRFTFPPSDIANPSRIRHLRVCTESIKDSHVKM